MQPCVWLGNMEEQHMFLTCPTMMVITHYDLIKVGGVWGNKDMAHNIPTINHLYY